MTPTLDITKDVCPMTFVKVKMGLGEIPPAGKLHVLPAEDALKNVISSLTQEGPRVSGVSRRESAFLLVVEKEGERP